MDIDALCQEVAVETSLPVAWVRYHVDRQVGGVRDLERVSIALAWVRKNTQRIRVLGEKREADAPYRASRAAGQQFLRAQRWKLEHPDLWKVAQELGPGDFREAILRAIEGATLTTAQENALRNMSSRAAPARGATVDTSIVVRSARRHTDRRFRVEFEANAGWVGKIEVKDENLATQIQTGSVSGLKVKGTVTWSQGSRATITGRLYR